ncbi:hypothetical protein K8I28_01845 [bacterium]|nr:hypothetical protein [bacterium]
MAISTADQNRIFKQCLHDFRVSGDSDVSSIVDEGWLRNQRSRVLAIFNELLSDDKDQANALKLSISSMFDFVNDLLRELVVEPALEEERDSKFAIRRELEQFKSDIETGCMKLSSSEEIRKVHPQFEWGTAGTIITSYPNRANYADRVIVTRHAQAIVWLIERLRTICGDNPSLYLANVETAISYIEETGEDGFDLNKLAVKMINQILNVF